MRKWAIAVIILSSSGCGADLDYKQARFLEAREPVRAAAAFERFLAKHPDDPRAPEASYRVGRVYADNLGRCPEARHWFEAAARSAGEFSEPAKLGLMACPDYFPLRSGSKWTWVDTLSGGKNMRLEARIVTSTRGVQGIVAGAFFAGEQSFRDYRRRYEKGDWTVWEETDGTRSPILRWPYTAGRSWTAPGPQGEVTYTIESHDARVKVKGGAYSACLKVRSQVHGYASWVFDYYCPGVGRVKNTVGVPGAENPNTELAAFADGT